MADGARILQLAPGSTDLKSAQTIALKDIAVGDRVLVTGKAGDDAGSFTASRVILMKSTTSRRSTRRNRRTGRSAERAAS